MAEINHFAVLGGDLRSVNLAISIAKGGDFVSAVGFEQYHFPGIVKKQALFEAVTQCTAVILPIPVSKDGLHLFAPYSMNKIELNDEFAELLRNKIVFCGMKNTLPQRECWKSLRIIDYAAEEEFAVRNAVPTAEGAIQLALQERDATLCGANCLIAGYGRIGRVLARLLKAFGTNVTISARKAKDIAEIEGNGWRAVDTAHIGTSGEYDLIFNTIPAVVFDSHTLERCAREAVYIELASKPFGADFEAAKRLNIPVIEAGGLPGKTAPRTAGEIIRRVILRYMRLLR